MSNATTSLRGFCPPPFYSLDKFPTTGGYIDGRMCRKVFSLTCCLPCPLTDWTYSDNFRDLSQVANWINVVGMICCAFLLLSWIFLPVEKTARHYLSISLTCAVVFMNLGFIIPLAAKPEQCFNEITPHGMDSSPVCAASGAFLLGGGWAGVMWVFLRSVSLHLQICWQVVVGRNFMWISQALGWGIPIIGLIILMLLSGVSFRFGQTCHINHQNSLGDFWIPLLVFAGLTVIIQFATFGYCIKVYLASLADSSASTEGSGLPAYSNSIRTMTPRQAYRRVRRVIQLQWRGIIIVLIIIADVIFFAVIFVFQDNTVEAVKSDPKRSEAFVNCLLNNRGDKNKCLEEAGSLVVNLPTVVAVLILLACNGLWLLLLLGRWSMVTGWIEYFASFGGGDRAKKEFVSVDARLDLKKDPRSYEMLSRDSAKTESVLTPVSASKSPTTARSGRQTPDYFGQTPRYQPHSRSFSAPRPPQQQSVAWDPYTTTYGAQATPAKTYQPTGGARPHEMTSSFGAQQADDGFEAQPTGNAYQSPYPSTYQTRQPPPAGFQDMNPLGMNRI